MEIERPSTQVLKLALRFSDEGRLVGLRYLIWGELKKSGKTLLAAALVCWWAYTRPNTEIIIVANDEKQALGRVYKTLVDLITHNPVLAASATIRATRILISNRTRIDGIALDYTGEAGGRQSLVSYDEPLGIMSERARRLFEELTPPPSEAESWVLMTTTAGFSGESELLEQLYRTGLQGERIDDDLELYRAGAVTMFWSHTPRQPWQDEAYYAEQRVTLRSNRDHMRARILRCYAGGHADRKRGCFHEGYVRRDEKIAADLLREWGWRRPLFAKSRGGLSRRTGPLSLRSRTICFFIRRSMIPRWRSLSTWSRARTPQPRARASKTIEIADEGGWGRSRMFTTR